MAKYAADEIPICHTCDSRDLTRTCKRCNVQYCKHYASATDLRFCSNCGGDVTIKESLLEKTVEHIKPDGTVGFSRKFMAKLTKLEGVDWLFAAHLIEEMDDASIDATIEYHRANVDLMLMEREARKQERYMKLASVKVVLKPRAEVNNDGSTKTKRVTTRTKDKDPAAVLLEALQNLAKAGLSVEQITAMLGKQNVK